MQKASAGSGDDEMTARRLLHRDESQAIVLGVGKPAAEEGPRMGIDGVRREPNRGRHAGDTTTWRVCEAREEPAALAAIAGNDTKQRAPCVDLCPPTRPASSCSPFDCPRA